MRRVYVSTVPVPEERAGGVSRIQSVSVFRARLTVCPRCVHPHSVSASDISTPNFALCMSMIVLQTRIEGHLEEKKKVSSFEKTVLRMTVQCL